MLGPDLIAADEVAGWARLVASTQAGPDGLKLANGLSVPPYSIPDHLTLSGEPCWFPGAGAGYDQGDGKFGFLPPADNPFYFIQMVREHLRQTGNGALLGAQVKTAWGTETLAEACTRAFDSVEVDANGLVVVGNGPTDWRVDWGFADTVHKTGACLMPSVLRWRAAKDLVLLFAALNDRTQIAKYDQIARDLPLAIANAFYHPLDKENGKDVGMLYSATGQGHKDDIWASAYAVAIGAVRTRTAVAVAQHLRIVYQAGGTVVEGHVRPLLPSGSERRLLGADFDAAGYLSERRILGFPRRLVHRRPDARGPSRRRTDARRVCTIPANPSEGRRSMAMPVSGKAVRAPAPILRVRDGSLRCPARRSQPAIKRHLQFLTIHHQDARNTTESR